MNLKSLIGDWAWRIIVGPPPAAVEFDNSYPWLNHAYYTLVKDPISYPREPYAWGIIQGAALAKVLNYERISVVEFGVAGGNGLLSMEHIAQKVELMTGLQIDVYGFDSGTGIPTPIDYRDQPNMWFTGQFPMKLERLKPMLQRARLYLGNVRETVPAFIAEQGAPVAFVSFDLDLYSSTRDALALFNAEHSLLVPRVICYFDDTLGHTYSEYTGERLAINEFNANHNKRKIDIIHALNLNVYGRFRSRGFWGKMYWAHFFDHPLYNELDSRRKGVYTDEHGYDLRTEPDSDWKGRI